MYSNNNGFNLVDILIKIIFFIAFIFVLTFLFPQVKDLNPFYNNIFRENIKYMQDAAESYFNNNLPIEMGETKKLTLKEMIEQNLIIPFVDKDNNSCNLYKSYAEITKVKEGYKLRVNLVCNTENNYIEKTLGCNNFCDGVNCKNLEDACKNCDKEDKKCYDTKQVIYHQFQKLDSGFNTSYYCEEGLSLRDGICYKTVRADRIKATAIYDEDKTMVKQADYIAGTTTRKYIPDSEFIKTVFENKTLVQVSVSRIETYVSGGTVKVSYSCTTNETKEECTTVNEKVTYNCNCRTVIVKGVSNIVCDTCTKTVPVQKCTNVTVPVQGTCYRNETKPGYTKYSCPSEATSSTGSDESLKCFKDEIKTTNETKIECPSYADGSIIGPPLQCYNLIVTPAKWDCSKYPGSIKNTDKCLIIEKGSFKGWSCPTGYTPDGDYCNLDKEESSTAKTKTSSWSNWLYEWSTKDYMEGWTRTGQTRVSTSKVEVPCK